MSLFEICGVSQDYGWGPVLQNINFHLTEGESTGIIGPNGSGKSTLIRVISGLLVPSQGEVRFRGKTVHSYRKRELARQIAVLEQEGTAPLPFTVKEVVAMGRYPWLKPFSELNRQNDLIVEEVLTTLGLWEIQDQSVNTLSGGQRQLVSLARAMAQQPTVLILDEPTTYLDIGHQVLVMQHVRRWRFKKGITVIMVLHDLNLAGQYCDKFLLMEQGHIRACGNATEVMDQEIITSVYGTRLIKINHPVLGVPQFLLA
ncbi:ABC transporter ATP-binding protein [Desulfosporosinus sp. FKA]|uniref:ABC transporter ATP-binding protein n=1 Tax=Desulfosporosinus sp. FKA TaxID=1969834 RepID=UPI000B49C251|nr:ABC transporter ATP-binding protein [Desulfosporosinus sp. FKA]